METSSPAAGDRDSRGRFTAGNHGGRGNPHARRMAALRQALLSATTEERMRELGERLYAAALAGDWQAAGLFLRYVVGRPGEAVDPDRVDLDEWQMRRDGPDFSEVLAAVRKILAKDALGILQTLAQAEEPVLLLPEDATDVATTGEAAAITPSASSRGSRAD
jgi:hypothetical protein